MKRLGFLVLSMGLAAGAAPTTKQEVSQTSAQANTQTQHSFEDLLVQGKYHFTDESVTTVEEDKVLDALIGVRTDFKDRLESSAERN